MMIQSKTNNHLSLPVLSEVEGINNHLAFGISTTVKRSLQISPFLCKTNPILSAVGGLQMNVTNLLTNGYEKMDTWWSGKNEPKTNPNEPKTNPNEPKTNPIKANKMPKQTQNEPKTNPNQTQSNPISTPPKGLEKQSDAEWSCFSTSRQGSDIVLVKQSAEQRCPPPNRLQRQLCSTCFHAFD